MTILRSTGMAMVMVAVLGAAPGHAAEQLTITPIDAGFTAVVAQFNPKEIGLDKSVPWTHRKRSAEDVPALEFGGAEPRSMSFDLDFDTSQTGEDVTKTYVDHLTDLANVSPVLKRPPVVLITWGTGLRPFAGVVESLDVQYSLFLPDGTPTHATCTVRARETHSAVGRGGMPTDVVFCATNADCTAPLTCNVSFCAPPAL